MKYTLIIAEKPKAAERIAKALSNGKYKVYKFGKFRYFAFENFKVIAALGHLFKLDTLDKSWNYPIFDVKWLPVREKGRDLTSYIKFLREVGKDCEKIIIATDYDIEGDVIGYNILRFIFNRNNALRAKFSSLTDWEIKKAFSNLMDSLDFGQVYAGLTRHYLDFYWGINLTRALTKIVNNKEIISCGRVQTPTLNLILQREEEIRNFVPKDFWTIKALLDKNGEKFIAIYENPQIFDENLAKRIFEECKKASYVKIEKIERKVIRIKPLPPFNLTTLQSEAYKFYKFSPSKTLKIAEELYLKGYITYPRTSSEKLPKGINLREILNSLLHIKEYSKYIEKIFEKKEIRVIEGKKDDPAHPAIIVTGIIPKNLSKEEFKIYDLIARRFIACLYEDLIINEQKVVFNINGYKFISIGKAISEEGWLEVYKKKVEEAEIPKISENDRILLIKINMEKKRTKPPKRYNVADIIKLMEKHGIGTKTTRSEIIETLYRRKFIEGKIIEITKSGEILIKVLEKFVPLITKVEMTRKFEEYMDKIMKGEINMEVVLDEAKKVISEIIKSLENKKDEIRKAFIEAQTH